MTGVQTCALPISVSLRRASNAGNAKSQGVELSTELRPLRGLTLSAWATWNQAVLTQDMPVNQRTPVS